MQRVALPDDEAGMGDLGEELTTLNGGAADDVLPTSRLQERRERLGRRRAEEANKARTVVVVPPRRPTTANQTATIPARAWWASSRESPVSSPSATPQNSPYSEQQLARWSVMDGATDSNQQTRGVRARSFINQKMIARQNSVVAEDTNRRRLVSEIHLRLAGANHNIDLDSALALTRKLEKKSVPALMREAMDAGTDLEEILERVEMPADFPISANFSGGDRAPFTPKQALIALIISLRDDLTTSKAGSATEELHMYLTGLSTSKLRMRAMRAGVNENKICDAFEDPLEAEKLKDLIIKQETALALTWPSRWRCPRFARKTRFVRERPKNFVQLSAVDLAQRNLKTAGVDKTNGESPARWASGTVFASNPLLQIMGSFEGTVLPWAFSDLRLWLCVSVFTGVRVALRFGMSQSSLPHVNTTALGTIGGFLSFFIVFYLDQAYKRFTTQYEMAMDSKDQIFDICSVAAVWMTKVGGRRLWRHLNVAHTLSYVGLSDTFSMVRASYTIAYPF